MAKPTSTDKPEAPDEPGRIELDRVDLPPDALAMMPPRQSPPLDEGAASPPPGAAAPPAPPQPSLVPGALRAVLFVTALITAIVWIAVGVLYLMDWLMK